MDLPFWVITVQKASPISIGEEPRECKRYREQIQRGEVPVPRCRCCSKKPVKWGFYGRTDARVADGRILEALPVQRFRCLEHGTFSWLPPFLCPYLRYISVVVEDVLVEYAETVIAISRVLAADGPSLGTVGRWARPLESPRMGAWLERQLAGLCPEWRVRWLPLVESDHPSPANCRPAARENLQKLRSLTRLLSQKVETSAASLFQIARLSLAHSRSSHILWHQ